MNDTQDIARTLLKSKKFLEWRPEPEDLNPKLTGKDAVFEKHYSVSEIAKLWGISVDFVRDLFRDEPDVLALERTGSKKYTTLRVPEPVLVRVYNRLRQT